MLVSSLSYAANYELILAYALRRSETRDDAADGRDLLHRLAPP